MSITDLAEVGVWVVIYLGILLVGLWLLSGVLLTILNYIPSAPVSLESQWEDLYYKGELVASSHFIGVSAFYGCVIVVGLLATGLVLLLGLIGSLLGIPIPS